MGHFTGTKVRRRREKVGAKKTWNRVSFLSPPEKRCRKRGEREAEEEEKVIKELEREEKQRGESPLISLLCFDGARQSL